MESALAELRATVISLAPPIAPPEFTEGIRGFLGKVPALQGGDADALLAQLTGLCA